MENEWELFYFRTSDGNISTTFEAQTTTSSSQLFNVTSNIYGDMNNLGELENEKVADISWPFIITGNN